MIFESYDRKSLILMIFYFFLMKNQWNGLYLMGWKINFIADLKRGN